MRLQVPQVQPLEQPRELLLVQSHNWPFKMERPAKPLLLEPLLPQAKTRALPVENLDLIASPVDEGKQVPAEGIESQCRLDENTQAGNTKSEIDRIAAQIDGDLAARPTFRRSNTQFGMNFRSPRQSERARWDAE
jgi:hypothetical protein